MLTWAADKISSARNALFVKDHQKHPKNHNISLPEADFSSTPSVPSSTPNSGNYGLVHFNHDNSFSKDALEYSSMTKPTGVIYENSDNSYDNNIISFDKTKISTMPNSITSNRTYNGVKITDDNMTIDFSNRPKHNAINYQ